MDGVANRGVATQSAGNHAYATVARSGLENDLLVVDTRTGAVLDRERLPGVTRFTVGTTIGPDGTVYVPTIAGDVFAFRSSSPRRRQRNPAAGSGGDEEREAHIWQTEGGR